MVASDHNRWFPALLGLYMTAGCSPTPSDEPLQKPVRDTVVEAGSDVLTVPIRLHLGHNVDIQRARESLLEASRCLQRAGLSIVEATEPRRLVAQGALFERRADSDDTAAGVNARDDPATRAVYGPLTALILRISLPSRPWVNVVMLERIATPDSLAGQVMGRIEGLGLAPGDHPDRLPGMPLRFTPTAIVTVDGDALGHELGHALGLRHSDANDDHRSVMAHLSPGPAPTPSWHGPCQQTLTAAQRDALRQRLQRLGRNLP